MKELRQIISLGIVTAQLVGLLGCGKCGSDNQCGYNKKEGSVLYSIKTNREDHLGIAIGDLDNDRLLDIIVSNNMGVYVLKNKGKENFTEKQEIFELRNYDHLGIAIGDLDNDGLLDIIVSNSKGIYIIKNKGNLQFEKPSI